MKPIYAQFGGALALTLAIAACVPAPRTAPSAPARAVTLPTPAPVPPPASRTWMDAPQTTGDWRYLPGAGGGIAMFGAAGATPLFAMRCERAARVVILARTGVAAARQMTVHSETQNRTLAAAPVGQSIEARLAAGDRLLDAMALSKGRFAIEVPGAASLFLPSWAEVTRVIEDCR